MSVSTGICTPKYFEAMTSAAKINEMMKVTNDGADGLILRPSVI